MPEAPLNPQVGVPDGSITRLSGMAENSCLMAIDALLAVAPRNSDTMANPGSAASPCPLAFVAAAAAQIAECMIATTRDFQAAIQDGNVPRV